MIIAVLEYPNDDQAQVFFIDIKKLDQNNIIQRRYYDNIQKAQQDLHKAEYTSFDASIIYGEDIFERAVVNPPCQIDDSITLYVE